MLDTEASIVVKKKNKEQAGLTTQPYRRDYGFSGVMLLAASKAKTLLNG